MAVRTPIATRLGEEARHCDVTGNYFYLALVTRRKFSSRSFRMSLSGQLGTRRLSVI